MTFKELSEQVARRVYVIEMAEGMIPAHESEARWDAMKGRPSGPRVDITRSVGSTLIALKEMKLINYE